MKHTLESKQAFLADMLKGKSTEELMELYSDVSIYSWIRVAKARGTLIPIKQPGRPEKFSERSKRQLRRTVEQDPSLSIAAAGRASGVQASHKTIVKILNTKEKPLEKRL
jgi:transposase